MNVPLDEIKSNLTSVSFEILKLLDKKKQMNFTQLKDEIKISAQKLYIEIALLKGGALILLNHDPRDQRIIFYSLSKYGKALLKY